jgi:hypothetical protein
LNFFLTKAGELCAMQNSKNIEETILMYTSAWNETKREAIVEKINEIWATGGTYCDPVTNTITGREAITELIISSYAQLGPRTFKVLDVPEHHHQRGRFRWLAIRPEGYPIEGMDYFEFDDKNCITRIVGFFKL